MLLVKLLKHPLHVPVPGKFRRKLPFGAALDDTIDLTGEGIFEILVNDQLAHVQPAMVVVARAIDHEFAETAAAKTERNADGVIYINKAVPVEGREIERLTGLQQAAAGVGIPDEVAKVGFRSVIPSLVNKKTYPKPKGLFTINNFGGWTAASSQFFTPRTGLIAKAQGG